MISLTRLNHTHIVLNCDLIEYIETTPDTVISLTTGQKLMVLETAEEVIALVIEYRQLLLQPPVTGRARPDGGEELSHASSKDSHGR